MPPAALLKSYSVDKLALFVDARNVLYRAIYAARSDRQYAVKYHYVVILLRQFVNWMRIHKPSSVHVFWDAPRNTIWRRAALATYKDRSNSQYVEDISEDLAITTTVATELFQSLNVRQYARKQMEADDLIYAAATVIHPQKAIIISTDSDLLQIPFLFNSISVFDPKSSDFAPIPSHHPALMKSIVGDKSDAIDGYYGIGPKKGTMLLENPQHLQEFLDLKGRDIYHRNLLLTDLSLCPRLLANKLYIQRIMAENVTFNKQKVAELIKKYKILGLDSEYANIIPPFSKLS